MTNEAEIEAVRALEYQIEAACVTPDPAWLDGICADDFTCTHNNGLVEAKESWLQTFPAPGRFRSRQLSELAIEVRPDVAYVVGRVDIEAGERKYAVRYLRVYAKREGRWRWVSQRTLQALPLS